MRILPLAFPAILVATLFNYPSDGHATGRTPPAAELVERLLSSTDPGLTSYRAVRVLEAEARGGRMRGQLTAVTSLDSEGGFQFEVLEESGSGIIRGRVLRAALEAEQKLTSTGDSRRGALTPTNYEFGSVAELAGDGLTRIRLRPKRRDTLLLDGSVLLTEPDGDLTSVEGYLVKRPSFWTREVHVTRRYERINGVRVPVSTESRARVLMAGRSTFAMSYRYLTINGVPVETTDVR